MGSGISSPLHQNLNHVHTQLMRHAGADYDIATATTLTYSQFISYITELNRICVNYKDKYNCILVFAVKKGTDASIFWKATVRIACVKLNTERNEVESHRLLNIRQFLQVFRRISYECTEGEIGLPAEEVDTAEEVVEGAVAVPALSAIPPTVAASMVLKEANLCDGSFHFPAKGKKDALATNLEECVICLERKPEVILPCCHAYCTPCIEQWWEYCQMPKDDLCIARHFISGMEEINEKSCPVCRECFDSSEDTWVLSEAPDQSEVSEEIRKALISYATSTTKDANGAGCSFGNEKEGT